MGCGIIHWNPGFCKEGQGGFVGFRALRASGRGNCVRFCGRPRGPPLRLYVGDLSETWRAGFGPAPTADKETVIPFCRGGPRPARGGAHPRVASLGLRPIHLQPLSYSFQKTLPDLGRGGPWVSHLLLENQAARCAAPTTFLQHPKAARPGGRALRLRASHHLLGKARRRTGTALVSILGIPGPSGPD